MLSQELMVGSWNMDTQKRPREGRSRYERQSRKTSATLAEWRQSPLLNTLEELQESSRTVIVRPGQQISSGERMHCTSAEANRGRQEAHVGCKVCHC